jgi:CheY-like chemotaxis protein
MKGDRKEALAAGCEAFLAKPIDPAAFRATVQRFGGRLRGDLDGSTES